MVRATRQALTGCCVVFSVGAASAADLLDVFRQAQSADTTYATARATWAASQERIPQGRSGLLPVASLSASTQYNDRDIRFRDQTVPTNNVPFNSNALTLSVTQPIFRMQNIVVYQQAFTQAEQADAQLAVAAQDLILRVAQAYFDVLLAQDTVAFAEAQKSAIGQQLEQAKRNFEVGTATITDTHEAQARYDLTTAQEIAARNDVELRKRALEQVIARAAPPLAPLGPAFTLKAPEPAVMDTWVGFAQQRNLQVRVAESALSLASQEIERNRSARYPTLDAFASYATTGAGSGIQGGPGIDTRNKIVGLQLALPIYQGGALTSRVRESIANAERARQELESARRTAEFTARQAYLGITSGMAQVQALEAALVSTQSQLASTRLGQEVGVRTQVDILNAQQQFYSARRDLAQSKYTYVLSLLRLEAAIGELTEDDLVAVNQWLDRSAAGGSAGREVSETKPVGSAPATIAAAPTAAPAASPDTEDILAAVNSWARAWASNDVVGYLAHYAADFQPPKGLSRPAWEAERNARIRKPRRIEVSVESPAVQLEDATRAIVTFRQQYRSGALKESNTKTLVLGKNADRWLIQQERVDN
jgi:outer membrane protein